MKIIDVPQTGKIGLQVAFQSRYGLIRRTRAIPKQPNTWRQLAVRSRLTLAASGFDALTQDQQDQWNTAAAGYHTKATLGQSGPLTGLQLFVKINTTLAMLGSDAVLVPPPYPVFPAVAPQNVVITNLLGVIKITMTCPTSPGENTVLSACAPQKSGVRRAPQLKLLGTCPAPVQGSADITSLYQASFGLPVENQRIFFSAHQMTNGWTSPAALFTALVPHNA
jgi:hypothetical protein